jgi:hypothetical protein
MRSRILVPFDERFSVFGRELVKSAGKRIMAIPQHLHSVPGVESHESRNQMGY